MREIRDINVPGVAKTMGFQRTWHLLNTITPAYTRAAAMALERAAKIYLKRLREQLKKVTPARAAVTLRIYRKQGIPLRGTKTLILTGDYQNQLAARITRKTKDQLHWTVGGHKEDMHWSGLNMKQLAHLLEFGDPRHRVFGRRAGPLPPRPHHAIAWRKFKRTELRNLLATELRNFARNFWVDR